MAENKTTKPKNEILAYLEKLVLFYFSPRLRTILTSIYLVSFVYASLYYFEHITLAAKFLIYTIISSTALISISNLLWGVAFVLALIFPFSFCLYSIFLLYRIWVGKTEWSVHAKAIGTIVFLVVAVFGILIADDMIHFVASQDELRNFIEDNYLNGRI